MSRLSHQGLLLSASASPPSGFPTYAGGKTSHFDVAATSHAVAMPAIVNLGDLLIIQFAVVSNAVPTTPSGWTQFVNAAGGAVIRLVWYYKIADGTEGGTSVAIATANAKATAIVHRIASGTYSSIPEATTGTSNSSSFKPPELTPTWGVSDTLWILAFSSRNRTPVSAWPSPDNNQYVETNVSANTDCCSASCTADVATGTISPEIFSRSTNATAISVTVAVRPV